MPDGSSLEKGVDVMKDMVCPIWNTPARGREQDQVGHYRRLNSPRAGGLYEISGSAIATVKSIDTSERARLTTWIVDQHSLGNEMPVVNSSTVSQARQARRLTFFERRDRLVRYLAWKLQDLGSWVGFQGTQNEEKQKNKLEMLAWTESLQERELDFLVRHLVISRHIEASSEVRDDIRLAPDGYKLIEELDAINTESSRAFVAMWFDESMSSAYEQGFERAVSDAGYRPLRIDRVEHINKIDDEIIAAIRRSRFLIADFTSEPDKPRGGVYFEAGFAYGLNIPVIWCCRKDLIDQLHFDTRQFNHIAWDDPEDLYIQLKNRIEAVIGRGPLSKEELAN
jgi:hypothetical protein